MTDYKQGSPGSTQEVEEGSFEEERREQDKNASESPGDKGLQSHDEGNAGWRSRQTSSYSEQDDSRLLVPSSLELGPGAVPPCHRSCPVGDFA